MSQKDLRFSHDDYIKLIYPFFPTIRRRDKYPQKAVILDVKTPERVFKALLLGKFKIKLEEIGSAFLRYDTSRIDNIPKNREEAIGVLNSFYQIPLKGEEKMTILFCLRKSDIIQEGVKKVLEGAER